MSISKIKFSIINFFVLPLKVISQVKHISGSHQKESMKFLKKHYITTGIFPALICLTALESF